MTINNPTSGNDTGLSAGQNIPQDVVQQMMMDACTIHGLIEALDLLAGDGTPAISAIITCARPLAKKLANDLSLQW